MRRERVTASIVHMRTKKKTTSWNGKEIPIGEFRIGRFLTTYQIYVRVGMKPKSDQRISDSMHVFFAIYMFTTHIHIGLTVDGRVNVVFGTETEVEHFLMPSRLAGFDLAGLLIHPLTQPVALARHGMFTIMQNKMQIRLLK